MKTETKTTNQGEKMTKLKTMTLGENPDVVICPGHVDQKTFNAAFKNEGWSEPGGYKQKDLQYIYMTKQPLKKSGEYKFKKCPPTKLGAKPYTFIHWD